MNEVDLVIGFLRRTDFRGLQYFLTPYPMLNQVTYIKEAIEVVAITSSLGEIKRFVELGDPNQKGAENLPEILFLVATVADMFIWEAEIEDTEPEGGVL